MENKLILLVEMAVTIMAFSSIIFQVKTTSDPSFNGFAFMGILAHSFLALLSASVCLILFEILTNQKAVVQSIGLVLGILTMIQSISVLMVDQKSTLLSKFFMFTVATGVFLLQVLNFFEVIDYSGGYLLAGILFHLIMSLVLFLIMITQEVKDPK